MIFKVKPIVRGGPRLHEVLGDVPQPGWHKVNFDGAARGKPRSSSCGGIFQNYRVFCIGLF